MVNPIMIKKPRIQFENPFLSEWKPCLEYYSNIIMGKLCFADTVVLCKWSCLILYNMLSGLRARLHETRSEISLRVKIHFSVR